MDELMIVDGGLTPQVAEDIANLEKAFKELEAKEKEIKAKLMEIMEKHDIKKIDNDFLTISRVPGSTMEKLDTKALKEELPDIYDTYVKIQPRAGYLKITLKG
jgi:predicted phage-related endonuclease